MQLILDHYKKVHHIKASTVVKHIDVEPDMYDPNNFFRAAKEHILVGCILTKPIIWF